MKILYLASDWGLSINQNGGAGTHMRGTIKGFEENGHQVKVIIGGDVLNNTEKGLLNTNSLTKERSPFLKKIFPDKFRLLLRELRYLIIDRKLEKLVEADVIDFQPDVIYERSAYYNYLGNRLSKKLKIPLFLETDGCIIEVISSSFGVLSKRIGNWIEKKKLQNADYTVIMNKYAIDFISKKYDLKKNKIITKKLGIEIPNERFFDLDTKKNLGIEEGDIVVGFVGTFAPYQGVNYLIESAKKIKNIASIKFVIVGWGNNAEYYKEYVAENNLKNIIFTGKIDKLNINKYISIFDIAVVPDAELSIYPIKTLEYGLFGACPLVPNYKVFDEIIQEGVDGYTFEKQDFQSLTNKIVWMSKNVDVVKAAGNSWNRKVINEFTWNKVVIETLDHMQKIVILK